MDLLESLKPDIILYIITCTIFTCSNFGYAAWLRLDNKKVQRYNMLFQRCSGRPWPHPAQFRSCADGSGR